ncbi:MAG: hypothetical protein ACRC2R_25405 [Xenococcaceae cyanobacterium]
MQRLPDDVKIKFFRFLHREESIGEFEQWIYARNDLEKILGNVIYQQ